MATNHSTQAPDVSTPGPLFEHFHWHAEFGHTPDECLAEAAQDIGSGLALALRILESDDLALANDERPFLSVPDRGSLMRLAIASASLLARSAERTIEWHDKYPRKAGTGSAT